MAPRCSDVEFVELSFQHFVEIWQRLKTKRRGLDLIGRTIQLTQQVARKSSWRSRPIVSFGLHGGACGIDDRGTHPRSEFGTQYSPFHLTRPPPPSFIRGTEQPCSSAGTVGVNVISKSWILFLKKEEFSACNLFRRDAPSVQGVVRLWTHYSETAIEDVPANGIVREPSQRLFLAQSDE